jgi:hypothetical protein
MQGLVLAIQLPNQPFKKKHMHTHTIDLQIKVKMHPKATSSKSQNASYFCLKQSIFS